VNIEEIRREALLVAQTSKSAVPQVSKPAGRKEAKPTWKSAVTAAPKAFGAALRKFGRFALNRYRQILPLETTGIEWGRVDSALTKSKPVKASQS